MRWKEKEKEKEKAEGGSSSSLAQFHARDQQHGIVNDMGYNALIISSFYDSIEL